jgi:26S proteasome regulatory subunit N3
MLYVCLGFKQHVAKLSVTVDLLLGNIPERSSFLLPGLKVALAPYLQLAQVQPKIS